MKTKQLLEEVRDILREKGLSTSRKPYFAVIPMMHETWLFDLMHVRKLMNAFKATGIHEFDTRQMLEINPQYLQMSFGTAKYNLYRRI